MMNSRFLIVGFMVALGAAIAVASAAEPLVGKGVAPQRLERLARGINLSHWFAQVYDGTGYTEAHFREFITAADLKLIRDLGFTYVRLPLDPRVVFDVKHPQSLDHDGVASLDAAIDSILAHDLAVLVDLHPERDLKKQLQANPTAVGAFASQWALLAGHLAKHDAGRVFFELMNEPTFDDRAQWQDVQRQIASAVRQAAPKHTLIACGARWSAVDELVALEPLADRNVVYNFHYYEPGTFTHQGTTWAYDPWKYCKHVPYPATPQRVAAIIASVTDEAAKSHLTQYGQEGWNAQRVSNDIARAAAWGKRHDVPLMCNEFGVYKPFAPPADRAAWIRDVRVACERHGIGWAMWDYAGGFSIVSRKDDQIVPDERIVAALGLKPDAGGRSTKSREDSRSARAATLESR